ncbi:MAG: hypothetical protein ACLTDS_08730 [Bianqueaceae bacterium]
MEFRDLRKQYQVLEKQMNSAMIQAVSDGHYIMGKQVLELEEVLADYVESSIVFRAAMGPTLYF